MVDSNERYRQAESSDGSNNKKPGQTIQRFTSNMCAVLNDPRKDRNKINCLFTKTWGSEFTDNISQIPKTKSVVAKSDFNDYIKVIAPRHSRHVKSIQDSNNTENQLNSSSSSIPNDSSDIEKIPKIFFDPNFSLENKDTFDKIISFKLLSQMNKENKSRTNGSVSNKRNTNPFLQADRNDDSNNNPFLKNDNKSELLEKVTHIFLGSFFSS